MAISRYALKKKAQRLREKISELGFETEDTLRERFQNYCRTHGSEVPHDNLGRLGFEVLWLERIWHSASRDHATHQMRKAHWDRIVG